MSRHKIMLVDDERLVLNALERSLRREGYELIIFQSGADALEYLKKDPNVDVIVSDHRMPRMTGLELLIEARRQYPGIVRILLTGHADISVAIEAINEGKLYRFLTKPWQDVELKNHLKQAISFKKAVGEAREAVQASRKGQPPKDKGSKVIRCV